MIAKMIRRLSVSVLCAGFATAASATPLVWNLSGVTFEDGGKASGSFVYDADSSQFSSVNVTTTTGFTLPGAIFHYVCTSPCTAIDTTDSDVVFLAASSDTNLTGTPGLGFRFTPALDNSGTGTTVNGGQAVCVDSVCSGGEEPSIRSITAGSVWTLLEVIFADGFDP